MRLLCAKDFARDKNNKLHSVHCSFLPNFPLLHQPLLLLMMISITIIKAL